MGLINTSKAEGTIEIKKDTRKNSKLQLLEVPYLSYTGSGAKSDKGTTKRPSDNGTTQSIGMPKGTTLFSRMCKYYLALSLERTNKALIIV